MRGRRGESRGRPDQIGAVGFHCVDTPFEMVRKEQVIVVQKGDVSAAGDSQSPVVRAGLMSITLRQVDKTDTRVAERGYAFGSIVRARVANNDQFPIRP